MRGWGGEWGVTMEVPFGLHISDNNWKFSVTIGTLLYSSGSCERHSKPTTEMRVPLTPIPKEATFYR